jgi:hypothetical protein
MQEDFAAPGLSTVSSKLMILPPRMQCSLEQNSEPDTSS